MKVCVYQFNMGDVEDPEVYVANPLYDWRHSEQGKWVLEHSIDTPSWNISISYETYGYKCSVIADLNEHDLLIFKLKWSK